MYEFAYTSGGALASITDAFGNATTIERNGAGAPTAIVAPGGQRTTLTSNANGYLASVTNPAGESISLEYGTGGLLTELTDPRLGVHSFGYDAAGRLIRDEDPAGGVKTLARTGTPSDYTVTFKSALDKITTFRLETLRTGEVRRTRTDPNGAETRLIEAPSGKRTVFRPDGTKIEQVTGPDDRFGMAATGSATVTATLPSGRTLSTSTSRSVTLANRADIFSVTSSTERTTSAGQTTTRVYDAGARTVTTTTPAGRSSVATLDAKGRVQSFVPTGGIEAVEYSYDAKGRLTERAQGSDERTFGYDAGNRLTTVTDSEGRQTKFTYDGADRQTRVELPSGRTYQLAYDANGNRTGVTMPSTATHTLGYSAVDRMTSYQPPGSGAYGFVFDKDGRQTGSALPSGRTQTRAYDDGGRLTSMSYPEGSASFAYAGSTRRLTTATSTPAGGGGAQAVDFSYDGWLSTQTAFSGAAEGTFSRTHDDKLLASSVTLESLSTTSTQAITRDADGLITQYGPFSFNRNGAGGDPSQIGDGTASLSLAYDGLGRTTGRNLGFGLHEPFAMTLTYDSIGRVAGTSETIAGTTETYAYSYDLDGRLTEVRRGGVVLESYAYDANANRTSRLAGGSPEAATYDAQDRLVQRGGVAYAYDADGFMTNRGGDTFSYSARGELLQATVGSETLTYRYDALGRRVARTSGGTTVQYLYGDTDDSLRLTHSRNGAGEVTTYYYDDGGRLIALQRGATRYYVATDLVGSPRAIFDSAGTLVKRLDYDSFGALLLDSNPAFELAVGYAGGLADSTTGLVRFGARDYDPEAGRWTSRDPALYEGREANLYGYVGNNPVSFVDRTGMVSFELTGYAGFGGGIKLAITWDGISACGEMGFGVGGGASVDPFGEIDRSGTTLMAEASATAGPIGAGIKHTLDDCGALKTEAKACVGPFCAKGDKDYLTGETGIGAEVGGDTDYSVMELLKATRPKKFGAEAKIAGQLCLARRW